MNMIEYKEVEVRIERLREHRAELRTFQEDTYDPSNQNVFFWGLRWQQTEEVV